MKRLLVITCLAAALGGCKVAPVQRGEETTRFKKYLADQKEKISPQTKARLSMTDCERIALANSLGLQLQRQALKISDENVNLALSNALPHASMNYTDTHRSNDNSIVQGGQSVKVADRHEQNMSIGATVPILDWGITYYSYQIAKDRRAQDELLLVRTAQLLVRDVRVAYTKYAGAKRQEKLLQQAYQAGLEVLRVARSLEKAGETVVADTALVQASVAQAEVELALVQKRISETRIDLARLMSLPPAMVFEIDDTLPSLPELPDAATVESFENRALTVRPELAAQDLQQHISAYEVRQAAAAFFPRVDGIGGFNWTGNSQVANQDWFYGGVQVSYGLLNGGADIFRYSSAKTAREIEKGRSLLLSLGILYDVDLQALTVKENYAVMKSAGTLEEARRAALTRVVSLYKEGLEDEAGAARALADLTTQSTAMDRAVVAYLNAWHDLEATVLPDRSWMASATTRPTTAPAN